MKTNRIIKGVWVFCIAMLATVFAGSNKAWASTGFKEMFQQWQWASPKGGQGVQYRWAGDTVKVGDYYFKGDPLEEPDDMGLTTIYISDKKNSGFLLTPLNGAAYTNGKEAYYIDYSPSGKEYLCRYRFSSRKETKVKKLPKKSDWWIRTIYGGKVYLLGRNLENGEEVTCVYDINKKTLSSLKNFAIEGRSGKYVISLGDMRDGTAIHSTLTLWKITASGLKKVKILDKNVGLAEFSGNKLYYQVYKDGSGREVLLYRCNVDGTNKKKLAAFKVSGKEGSADIMSVGPDACVVYLDGRHWKYTYATKKLKLKS